VTQEQHHIHPEPPDTVSDDLIQVITDERRTQLDREFATKKLFDLHSEWVSRQIEKSIYNPDDVQDIAQNVWMYILKPGKLSESYKNKAGKFRAFLRNPIRWAILKHIDKIPINSSEDGQIVATTFLDIDQMDESILQSSVNAWVVDEVIENIIKPNLSAVDLKPRTIFVANEYATIFDNVPAVSEVAGINGITNTAASELLSTASGKKPADCSLHQLSVYMPVEYTNLVDADQVANPSGAYLANLMGFTDAVFRKQLHVARKYLIDIVQKQIDISGGN